MPVRADVVDIRGDAPKPDDRIVVDTNVWYWLGYLRASLTPNPPQTHQSTEYPKYAKAALTAGSALHHFGFMHSEIANIIERDEAKIRSALVGQVVKPKALRHQPNQRRSVIGHVNATWSVVVAMSSLVPLQLDANALQGAVAHFANYPIGGYDVLVVEAMRQANLTSLLTDDHDFIYVGGLRVFTSNPAALNEAAAAGKVVVR